MLLRNYIALIVGLFFLIILYLGYFFSDEVSYYLSEFILSVFVLVVCFSVFLAFYILGFKTTSITVLFFVSLNIFIFGRYFSKVLDSDNEIFKIDFFSEYTLDTVGGVRLTFLALVFFISVFYGVILSHCYRSGAHQGGEKQVSANFAFPILFFLMTLLVCFLNIFLGYKDFAISVADGYLSLYSFQGEAYSGGKFYKSLFYVMLGLSYAFSMEKEKKILLISVGIIGVLSLLAGQRSGFVMALFLLLWAYGVNHRVSWPGVSTIFLLIFGSLISLGSLSARGLNLESAEGGVAFLSSFLYNQGISLMVFDASTKVSGYPVVALIQSFVPGASRFVTLFVDLKMQDLSYADYLANHLNSSMYHKGLGMGWSLPGTFFVWSFGNIFGFSFFSMVFGYVLKMIDDKSLSNYFYLGLSACLVSFIIILPRSQFSNLIPLAVYFMFFYSVCYLCLKRVR